MGTFLCFRLHGPLASWGDTAVGERRPSTPHPSRSAVLGLVAAALGLRRDDSDGLTALDRGLGFASRTDAPGELLQDFHTAQGPSEKLLRFQEKDARRAGRAWLRPPTRRAELAFPRGALDTLLSTRQYRVDAAWAIAVWLLPEAESRWTLAQLRDSLLRPHFMPYLGRKSCPLDLPTEPQLVDAPDPVSGLARARFAGDEVIAAVLIRGQGKRTVQWEGDWPGLPAAQSVRRRDRLTSRARWQFTEREEHQMAWGDLEGGGHVPEQG